MGQTVIKDPVCGMRMPPDETVHSSEYVGAVYRFCSEACKAKFDRDPARFGGKPRG
jgi:Cu+-exporting ATPase